MKRILFICHYFPPFGGGGTFRAAKFVKYLPEWGWAPTVVTLKPRAVWAEDGSLLEEIGARVVRTESVNPVTIYRELREKAPGLPDAAGEVLKKLLVEWPDRWMAPDVRLGWAPFAVAEGLRLHREEAFDAVLTNSPPHSTHFAGPALKRLTGLPWVADFKDGWMFCPFRESRGALRDGVEGRMERMLCREADALVTVSEPLAEYFGGLRREGAVCIPNGYDEEDFGVAPARFDVATIGYFGSLFHATLDPKPFLEGMKKFLEGAPEWRGRVRGLFCGPKEEALLGEMRGYDLPLEFVHYVAHREAVGMMMGCHAVVVLVNDLAASQGVITGKVFEYLRSGTPIIAVCPRGGALWKMLEGEKNVFAAAPGETEGIAECIGKALALGGERVDRVAGGVGRYERKKLAGDLAGVLDAVAGKRRRAR